MVPPKSGCGWQTTAAMIGAAAGGVQSTASILPADPCRKKFVDSCVELIAGSHSLHESGPGPVAGPCSMGSPPYGHANGVVSRFHFYAGYLSFPFAVAAPRRRAFRTKRYKQSLTKCVFAVRDKFQFVRRHFDGHRLFMPRNMQGTDVDRQRDLASCSVLILSSLGCVAPFTGVIGSLKVHRHIPTIVISLLRLGGTQNASQRFRLRAGSFWIKWNRYP